MSIPLTIHSLARAVIISNHYILLCKTIDIAPSVYFTPGGHIEPEENAKQALCRELLEETGFNFTINRFLGCIEYAFDLNLKHPSMVCHSREYSFFFEATSEEVNSKVIIPKIENHIELIWVNLNEIPIINLRPVSLKKLINTWLTLNFDQAFIPNE